MKHSFFYSKYMLYVLAALLVLVFFLPDLIGPIPALMIGGTVIGFALFVYNKWCQADDGKQNASNDSPK